MTSEQDKPKKQRRAPLSRERILQAAIAFADERGIDSLSMRKLGQALGVEAMSLYNHVANKEDLLDGIVEIVVSEIAIPEIGTDWVAAMRERATSAHAVLLRHPWATMLIVSRANAGPAMLRYVNATLGCLREAGLSYELVDRVWNAIDSYLYGFTLQELKFPFAPEEYAEVAKSYLPQIPAAEYPYLRALTQTVIDGSHHGLHEFEFGLNHLLNGLSASISKTRT